MILKKREETWQRTFQHLGLDLNILKEKSKEEICDQIEPFKSCNVKAIKKGDFKTQKIKKLIMEVINVELIGNVYAVKLHVNILSNNFQDIGGDEIMATFHSDCKEYFSKQIRRGKVLVL